jgi:hypothetical protein
LGGRLETFGLGVRALPAWLRESTVAVERAGEIARLMPFGMIDGEEARIELATR